MLFVTDSGGPTFIPTCPSFIYVLIWVIFEIREFWDRLEDFVSFCFCFSMLCYLYCGLLKSTVRLSTIISIEVHVCNKVLQLQNFKLYISSVVGKVIS